MLKKILLFLVLLFSFWKNFVFADSIPVENIFSDIDENYKYHTQLQELYDRWMIFPDEEWKFNPNELLNRDDFVGITMEVSCKECISPDTDYEYLEKYSWKDLFFDLEENNKNFYCIAEAENSWFVSWYQNSTTCENGVSLDWENPFCPENTIILEEAIAIIMRTSWILTNSEAEFQRQEIFNWNITEDLSDDVSPLNLDGSVYTFYPDLQKALEYEVVTYDLEWNRETYNLIDSVDWKIRPKQAISKEKFIQIAYVALIWNSCQEKTDNNLWLKIKVFNETCDFASSESCELSELEWTKTLFDFKWIVWLSPWDSIDSDSWYIWRFYDYSTGKQIKKYGEYLDNYDFLQTWKYRVYLRAISNLWNTWEVFVDIRIGEESTLNIWENNNFKVVIDANPISWYGPLAVDFDWIVSWDSSGYTYSWDFWDGNTAFWKSPENVYKEEWVYEVTLTVIDENNNVAYSTVLINVFEWESQWDIDKDGILDIVDACPIVYWYEVNDWCPIFDDLCSVDSECDNGFYCSSVWICAPKEIEETCEYNWWDLVFWNVVCNSCPCNYSVNFNSTVRNCDVIFPAITSPDKDTIYSLWNYFEIKK